MRLPRNNTWLRSNKSDILGDLWSSMGIDLYSNKGATRVSPRAIITTDDITDLGVPVGFMTFADQNGGVTYTWAPAGSYMFRMNFSSGHQTAFAKDNTSNSPTILSSDVTDIVAFGKDYLLVSSATDVHKFTASSGAWSETTGTPYTSGAAHMMCIYGTRAYIVDNSLQIKSFLPSDINTITTSSSNYLNLANKGYPITSISTLRSTSNRIWIGTINQVENGCMIFAWDGSTATDPNEAYIIRDAAGINAMVIKDDVPWVIDNTGRLLYFNGGSFLEAPNGRLPVKLGKMLKNALSSVNDRWIHPNGIGIVDGKIRILINNEYKDNSTTIEENMPSGVWEYDPQIGWYHVLALSLYVNSVSDFGQNRVSRVGALYAHTSQSSNASANGSMLLGAQIYSDSSTTKEIIAIDDRNDTVQKYGYFITTKIFSNQVSETWQKVYARFKKFLNSTDTIYVKNRTDDPAPVEASITWTSTTTFTTSTNVSSYVGYEVEGIQGKGSGFCAHIVSVSENAGTYTVTVDEAFTGASSGTAKVRIQNWKLIGKYNAQTVKFEQFTIGQSEPWIQIKVCMLFTGKNELYDLLLANTTNQPVK